MVTIIVLKFLGGVVLVGVSLVGVVIGVFLLTNRNGLADRFQQHEEDDAVAWSGPVGLRHEYFRRVIRLYGLGLIAWGAFYPCIALAFWLGPGTAGIFHVLAAVSVLGMFGIAFWMGWQSERTLTALGLPVLSFGLARVRSVPFQVNATFWAALSAGILVDFLGTLTLGLK